MPNTSQEDDGIFKPDILTTTAQERFGIDYLFPYQRLVISNILRSSGYFSQEEAEEAPSKQLVLLPTGAGKSLCFMLPACLLPHLTIVVFPLLGLMSDQKRRVEEAGMTAAVLRGGMDKSETAKLWRALQEGKVDMLLTNPEMLIIPSVVEKFKEIPISHIVVDEAHTVPEWGETFRPACLELGKQVNELNIPLMTAFTATASPLILSKMEHYLFDDINFQMVKGNPDRTNINYEVRTCLSRVHSLIEILSTPENLPAIVFCPTRRETERICHIIQTRLPEQEARFYHAGLSAQFRKAREEWFFGSKDGVLTGTCAYGLGMDKSNIRTVIHMTLPASVEAYLQESGRAGRDRKMAKAILLYHPSDKKRIDSIENEELKLRFEKLIAFAENSTSCRRESLLKLLDAEPEDCVSCDVCQNRVQNKDPNTPLFRKNLKKYQRHFTINQYQDFLGGFYSPSLCQSKYHKCQGFALLKDWNHDDIREALENLLMEGKVKMNQSLFWKGKLFVPKDMTGKTN